MHFHLGHHFYGAGNLGDDFMLAGFLAGLKARAPQVTCTCRVPFAREPLQARFPEVEWLPWDPANQEECLRRADLWLGLGGSPFQQARSGWFIDHLQAEAEACARLGRPMYYLGVGLQDEGATLTPEVGRLADQAAGIWTRDDASAERLAARATGRKVAAAADLSHLWFREERPPAAQAGRLNLTVNFDYGPWPGRDAALAAVDDRGVADRVWLVQEDRVLPGAERDLHARMPAEARARWRLLAPDVPGAGLTAALRRWSGAEWTLTSRYHAALVGAWAGSKVVVIGTNAKLAGVARALGVRAVAADAPRAEVRAALAEARAAEDAVWRLAAQAEAALEAFLREAGATPRASAAG